MKLKVPSIVSSFSLTNTMIKATIKINARIRITGSAETHLLTLFSRPAQAENWTKIKGLCFSCNLYFLNQCIFRLWCDQGITSISFCLSSTKHQSLILCNICSMYKYINQQIKYHREPTWISESLSRLLYHQHSRVLWAPASPIGRGGGTPPRKLRVQSRGGQIKGDFKNFL